LQNWRVEQFLAGNPVLYSFKRTIPIKANIPNFTLFEVPLIKRTPGEISFLDIPKDVIQNHILIHLMEDPVGLFALMLTCKSLQATCHRLLLGLAQRRFGPFGTPMAVMCAAFYEQSLPRKRAPKKKRTEEEPAPQEIASESLKEKLNLIWRDFKSSRLIVDDVDTLIRISIQKNGCIDNLKDIWQAKAQQAEARRLEEVYIQNNLPNRINEINSCLASKGYVGLSVKLSEDGKVAWGNDCIYPILLLFECNNEFPANRFLQKITSYVLMQTEQLVETTCAYVKFIQPRLFNTAFVNLKGNTEPFHPLLYLAVQMLLEIRSRGFFFYDRVMLEEEWLGRLAYLFSDEFRAQHRTQDIPGSGSYVCCWSNSDVSLRIICFSQSVQQPTFQHYCLWMRPWDPVYHLRLASPATGQYYTGYLPGHYISGGRVVYLAHCLMTKKN
jgi:hypothetical protein